MREKILIITWLAFGSQAYSIPVKGGSALSATPNEPGDGTLPEVHFTAAVSPAEDDGRPNLVRGEMRIRNWRPREGHCLYLPYADPDYGEDRGTHRRFDMLSAKFPAAVFRGGNLRVTLATQAITAAFPIPQLLKISTPADWSAEKELVLSFESQVPRLPNSDDNNWFYHGFMPELLDTCPPPNLDQVYYRRQVSAHYVGELSLPSEWQYLGTGKITDTTKVSVDQVSRDITFALGKNYEHVKFNAGDVSVDFFYYSADFLKLAGTVSKILPIMTNLLGPYPYPSLTIMETPELQHHGLPGVIALNTPAQTIFSKAQGSYLNWQHWMITLQLARQWYGGAIKGLSPDDDWLSVGIAEFVTLESIRRYPPIFNLFSSSELFSDWLSFDYLQNTEMSASLLRQNSPFATLTTASYDSTLPFAEQNPLLFTKHTSALRQLRDLVGDQLFFRFLRSLTKNHLHRSLSPKQFRSALTQLPSPFSPVARDQLDRSLTTWWTSDGWPDFALTDVNSRMLPNGNWISELTAKQEGGIDYPPSFAIKDASNRTYIAHGEPHLEKNGDASWVASMVTPHEPLDVALDPTHETFDADRFNNRLGTAPWSLFPGNANTLQDDAYTLLWLPYAFRRPGEPFSLGVQAALFRYISHGIIGRAEVAPGTKLASLRISDSIKLPEVAARLDINLSQNYDHDRLLQASLIRSPLIKNFPYLSMDWSLRNRERAGLPETNHGTAGIGANLQPIGYTRLCNYRLGLSFEKAPGFLAHGFNYDRRFGIASTECNITNQSKFSFRLFRGEVGGDGNLPQVALFKPTNLGEAHLRLYSIGTWVRSIATTSFDLYLPFFLPLPYDSLILSRQMRWRLYYDLGVAGREHFSYRSAGFGFLLPFGGDLSGAGSLALTRLSILVIAFNDVGGVKERKPMVTIDLTGDL
ncbi:MAG: M1 family aminopeptidase [Proteobacteria bacterium]|nr:M1 family aminopeptidase [Pseudomonadota bacterium]